jgi:ribosomal protein S18 acetylase RimI-like enzyme
MNHDPGRLTTKLILCGTMTERLDSEDTLTITIFGDTENAGAAYVGASLAAEIVAGFGPRNELPLAIVAHAGDAVVGGLNGSTHWGWCYIRQLWVEADWRQRGLGRRLLAEAEAQAWARDCVGLYVDTFDPGAAAFYERAGYTRFGRIEDFPPGHARTFLCKNLAATAGSS